MALVLIVDDDPQNRELLRARLEPAGYEVAEAAEGEAGLQAARSRPPDLAIVDVMMPRMNGWKLCSLLKADPATASVPVLMLTACQKEIEELRGWESGADEYLMKPWDARELLEAAHRLTGARTEGAP